MTESLTATRKCSRCKGTGRTNHAVNSGICFRCNGAGTVEVLTAAGKARAADRAARYAVLEAAAAEADSHERPSRRFINRRTLSALEATDPAAFEAALAAVEL